MKAQAQLFARAHRNECVFSPCRRYRYRLSRIVREQGAGTCCWVLANPSVADEYDLDPTLTRCADYTRRWGFREMLVVNVRAWVETESAMVPTDPLAIGPDNDDHIAVAVAHSGLVVCGWGELGGARGARVLELLHNIGATPHALRLTKAGNPYHPLYQRATLKPFVFGRQHV